MIRKLTRFICWYGLWANTLTVCIAILYRDDLKDPAMLWPLLALGIACNTVCALGLRVTATPPAGGRDGE